MTFDRRVTPVVLCGGDGTRLWPLSTHDHPKQLLAITAAQTMLQVTAARVADAGRYAPPIVVANALHADTIEAQLLDIGCSPSAILLEREARNTAPAITLAALSLHPDSIMLVMPSDHVIAQPDALHEAVAIAVPFASDNWLVTFGVPPSRAETGYGYIKPGEPLAGGICRVDRFVEKPVREVAEAMVSEGGHMWNAGLFVFRAGAYLEALAGQAPLVLDHARAAMRLARREGIRTTPDATSFSMCPSVSVDYAVMEGAGRAAMVPVSLGWSDVGSWDALYELRPHDAEGNFVHAQGKLVETSGCLVRSDSARVSMLGVSDLIVVATPDEILIMQRGRSQELKRLLP